MQGTNAHHSDDRTSLPRPGRRRRHRVLLCAVAGGAALAVATLPAAVLAAPPGWSQGPTLAARDGAAGDDFGYSVAISGDGRTALVGAVRHDGIAGAAYLFRHVAGGWAQVQELSAPDPQPFGAFGSAVALSRDGSVALVGALGVASDSGAAYVFVRGNGAWTERQKLTASDARGNDEFGAAVALSRDGGAALVGAPDSHGTAGAAYLFTRSGPAWRQSSELAPGAGGSFFGRSTALSAGGRTALVGAFGGAGQPGAAYVLTRGGRGWSVQKLAPRDSVRADGFGASVSLSNDGHTALVGAFQRDLHAGAAYVFAQRGRAWTQRADMTAPSPHFGDQFGESVALSGDGRTAVVGAYERALSGAAYVFRQGASWTLVQQVSAAGAVAGDWVGYSVAVDNAGHTAVAGAYGFGSLTGAACIFTTKR